MTTTTTLCIQVDPATGQTIGHPCLVSNIVNAFGTIPDNFEPFNRITLRDSNIRLGVYEVPSSTYILNSLTNVWEDSWSAVPMSNEQQAQVQQRVKTQWANRPQLSNFSAWVYDPTTNSYQPPMPRPTDAPDGQVYRWQGSTNSWQLAPTNPPNDGQQYYWNFTAWDWATGTPA